MIAQLFKYTLCEAREHWAQSKEQDRPLTDLIGLSHGEQDVHRQLILVVTSAVKKKKKNAGFHEGGSGKPALACWNRECLVQGEAWGCVAKGRRRTRAVSFGEGVGEGGTPRKPWAGKEGEASSVKEPML